MKKILAIVVALVLCLGMVSLAQAEAVKIGVLVPAVTHGWVGGITYNAEQYCKELEAAGTIEYKLYTSSNAEEMTTQIDEAMLWGAQALVIAPQWTGMEVAAQAAIDAGITVVAFDMDIPAEGIYKVTGDNESMGVAGAKYIVEKIGTEGTVVALPVPSSGSVSELRMKGFTETMAEIAPNVKIIEYATAFTREDGLKDMADILTANAKIDAVFSLDDETSIGALQAIKEAKRTDVKAITGGGGCQEYFNMMLEDEYADIWVSSATYSPDMIVDCINNLIKVLSGEEIEHEIVKPTTIVDRDNAADFLNADSPY